MTALRISFLFIVALCWANATVIAASGILAREDGSLLGVSLSVALIYGAIGLLIFLVQHRLLHPGVRRKVQLQ